MPSYTELPIVHINNYIWDLATGSATATTNMAPINSSTDLSGIESSVWDTSVYSFRPFYPVHENLAADATLTPYILYDYMPLPKIGTFWTLQREEAEYCIVGDLPQIYYVKNYITEALEKFNESAKNLNEYVANVNDITSASYTTNFKYITVDQETYIADERRLSSFAPKYITCIKLTYEYTK